MQIIIAKHSGFCMGVRMAMNTILRNAHTSNKPLQTLGPLIHNPQTIALLNKMNVSAIKSSEEITADTVVIRTHGVPPDTMNKVIEHGVSIIDVTCPHVLRIHKIIDEYYKKGYSIIIYGDEGHAEVVGLQGFARDKGYLVRNLEDISSLPEMNKVCLVAQTTQSLGDWLVVKDAVTKRFTEVKIFDTICRATDNRQKEVERLSEIADCVVIVGGKNSANSTRLYEIAKARCPKSLHVETEQELLPSHFRNIKTVAIVSGASTPSWLLQRVSEKIKEIDTSQKPLPLKIPFIFWRYFVAFNGLLALGAAFMTYAAQKLQGLPPNPLHLAASAFYIHSMYVLNRLSHIKSYKFEEVFKADPILSHRKFSVFLLILTGLSSLAIGLLLDTRKFFLLAGATIIGILYHVRIIPKNNLPLLRHRRLKDIPLSKDLGIATAWAVICTAAPFGIDIYFFKIPSMSAIFTFFFIFATSFTRTLFNDLHDIQRDMVVGRETLPILIGNHFSKVFPAVPAMFITLLIVSAVLTSVWSPATLLLLLSPVWTMISSNMFKRGKLEDETFFDAIIDFSFVLPALILFFIQN